ncbi:MAG: toll/interleukin-1 receptor domain-containing protein [Anaerolineae bacterium]|nr:toll/interleukin-1 receptor domain-containing protein [Anaerolineae bacterium]
MGNVFLSYSRKDKGTVERLKNRLEAAGHYVWIDIEDIRGGDQWRRAIAEAIRQADTFVLLLSSNAVKSDNVCKELNLAEENKSRVIPVAISSVAIPPEMQYQLAGVQRIDLATDFEHGLEQLLEALGGSDVPVAGDQAVSTSGQGPSPLAASPGAPPLPAAPVPKQGKGAWLRTSLFVIALVITVGAIGYLVVQRGNGGPKVTPGPTEITKVAEPTPITVPPSNPPTDTPTGTPTPTSTATAITTATPTATPVVISTGGVYQPFENGWMFWREDNREIYVVYRSGWSTCRDTWDGQDEYSCPETGAPSQSPPTPKRGFGKVWCELGGPNATIGSALEAEEGYTMQITAFGNGDMEVLDPKPRAFILRADGTCQCP